MRRPPARLMVAPIRMGAASAVYNARVMSSRKHWHIAKGGNAHQRSIAKTHQKHSELEVPESTLPEQQESNQGLWSRVKLKRSDLLALVGLLAAFGSWGYTALNPQPSIPFGLTLIGVAGLCVAVIIIHILECRLIGKIAVAAGTTACFWIFSKYIVIAPAFKHEFVTALEVGYNLRNECGNRTYYDPTPAWMRDAQEQWKAAVGSLLQRGGYSDDMQTWSNAQLVGLTSESNYNGFRCTEMAVKTAALETIVSRHYDPTIKPNPYSGPVYVLPQPPQPSPK